MEEGRPPRAGPATSRSRVGHPLSRVTKPPLTVLSEASPIQATRNTAKPARRTCVRVIDQAQRTRTRTQMIKLRTTPTVAGVVAIGTELACPGLAGESR